MSNPSKGKMWADIVMFFLACIPIVLCVLCFGAAGKVTRVFGAVD